MKSIEVNGVELAYIERGSGAETVVFSHSYLVDHRHFGAQIDALAERYRVIAFDHRDHGQSARVDVAYSIADLTADAGALIQTLAASPCHFIGLSTGGFVGLRLALRSPRLLRSLVVMDASAQGEGVFERVKYEMMFSILLAFGFKPLLPTVMGLMFSPSTLADPGRRQEMAIWRERMQANDRRALVRFGRAIFGRDDLLGDLHRISTPTLVVVGADDRPQPPARSRRIADGVPGAEFSVIPKAGHLSTLDAPDPVTQVLTDFLARQSGSSVA